MPEEWDQGESLVTAIQISVLLLRSGKALKSVESGSPAVISIPSFEHYCNDITTFSQAMIDFIGNATDRNAQSVIIDLQQNDGGLGALAFALFDIVSYIAVPRTSGSQLIVASMPAVE